MNDETPPLAEPIPLEREGWEPMSEGTMPAIPAGTSLIQAQGREITARKVAVPRNMRKIMTELSQYCAQFGDTYVYSWQVNDRRNNRKVTIEGGTIKLANDLVNLWGNCAVDCDIIETKTHWIFKAWFIDYERGVSRSRLFQQRKSQTAGMKDADRQADMIFQSGQSKAIRNVVLNGVPSLANFALEESKRGLVDKLQDKENRQKAVEFIDRVMEENGIVDQQVEAVLGRVRKDWTLRDLARVYREMRGIFEELVVIRPLRTPRNFLTRIKRPNQRTQKSPKSRRPSRNSQIQGTLGRTPSLNRRKKAGRK